MLVTRDRPKRKVERLLLRETKGGKRKVSGGGGGRGKRGITGSLIFSPAPLLESMFDLPLRGKEVKAWRRERVGSSVTLLTHQGRNREKEKYTLKSWDKCSNRKKHSRSSTWEMQEKLFLLLACPAIAQKMHLISECLQQIPFLALHNAHRHFDIRGKRTRIGQVPRS